MDEFNIDIGGDSPPEFNIDLGGEPEFKIDVTPPTGLAGFGGAQPESTVDWSAFKSEPDLGLLGDVKNPLAPTASYLRDAGSKIETALKPVAPQLIAGELTGGLGLIPQLGASLAAGPAGRYLEGDKEPFKLGTFPFVKDAQPGMIQDALWPIVLNTTAGIAKGQAAPLLKDVYHDIRGSIDDILDWKTLDEVPLTEAAARPLPAQGDSGFLKDVISSPVVVGSKAASPELQTLAKRIDLFPRVRARLGSYLSSAERDIFTQPDEGFLGKIGRRTEMPLSEREDVKLLMEGHKAADEVSARVRTAAEKLAKVYGNMGELGERWKQFGEDVPRIKGYSGPNIPRDAGEDVVGLASQTGVSHGSTKAMGWQPRVEAFDPTYHVVDAREGLRQYSRYAPERLASAYTLGAPGASTSEGTKAFGQVANELLNRAASKPLGKDQLAFNLLRDSLKQIYQTEAKGRFDKVIGRGGQALSTALLPKSFIHQIGQTATNVSRYSLQNTAEGITRYLRDPDFRALIESSGAKTGSMAHLFNEMQPGMAPNLVGKSIGWTEDKLRGILSAGNIPYQEDLLSRLARGESSRGLSRQLAELGIDINAVPSQPSASALRDAYAQGVGRLQLLSGEAGQTSASLIGNQMGRTIGQYKPFGLGQARLFRDDILAPLGSGLKNRDMSEFSLGAGRLARLIPAAVAAEAISGGLTGLQSLKAPDPRDILERTLRTNVGTPADIGLDFARGASDGSPWGGPAAVLKGITPPISGLANMDPYTLTVAALSAKYPRAGGLAAMLLPLLKEHGR
jgi:hypothetical protein